MSTPDPTDPLSTRRQLELMRDLQRLATARAEAEQHTASEYARATAAADARAKESLTAAEAHYATEREQIEQQLGAERERLVAEYQQRRDQAQQAYHGLRSEAEAERQSAKDEARQRAQDEAWEILTLFDAQKNGPQEREGQRLAQLREKIAEVQTLRQEASTILALRRMTIPAAGVDETPTSELIATAEASTAGNALSCDDLEPTLDAVTAKIGELRDIATQLYHQKLARLFEGLTPFGVVIGVSLVTYLAAAASFGPFNAAAIGAGAAAVALGGAGLWWSARPLAMRGAHGLFDAVQTAASEAEALIQQAITATRARRCSEALALIEHRNSDLAELGFEIEQKLGETKLRVLEKLGDAGETFPAKLSELRNQHQAEVAQLDARLSQGLAELASKHSQQQTQIEQQRLKDHADAEHYRDESWNRLAGEWRRGYEAIQGEAAVMRLACDSRFPDWSQPEQSQSRPTTPTMAIEFGRTMLDLARIKSGLSKDARLLPEQTTIELPTLLTLADQPSLVITANNEGRQQATSLLQTMALRWLVGQPPGKVRLTVLDPSGLGEGFASLMHLADYDEHLIAGRIWSEARDIDEQLLRLSTHIETVIQKYLRSEYRTIHQYNAQAGEVAEPFQVLVVNGFPTNFSDAACRRLMNLAASGPRCGVYVMLAVDRDRKPPSEFRLDDLFATAVHLDQDADSRFVWRYPAFEHLPLTLPELPSDERMVEIVRQAGEAAKEAIRVEVPFSAVTPVDDALWQAACDDELSIPVGRAGANRLQDVRLGRGTSQHLLVAGKTGSGKSTFLHALVTSAALRYSPDEVEFYLVDFKKGVEFKAYATHQLPHARVVAIESEREFGLSVLQRLDEELTRRGELYREQGVQTLADYRATRPDEVMPRQLLVIDEFQELFVQDDRLAQDATLLLDRLVRQGRAFGVHVLLGTQTLAGAYSLARSTLGQIAVRVALACSEADAHLILSDERNQAARFLSRPGEAIYNDQNGMVSANEPFQVVWLPDHERAEWLAKVRERGADQPAAGTVVFEGNAPADISRLRIADCGLRNDAPAEGESAASVSPSAVLGDAVAIKPPTSVEFGRHGGTNLLIVGGDERAATGMMASTAITLAAAVPAARIIVIDGFRDGEPLANTWPTLAATLPVAERTDPRNAVQAISEIAAEVARREAENDHAAPPLYLLLNNAVRLRDFRRSEDDFSFSMDKDKPPSPDKQLAAILRDGPGLGVHVIAWCDSYNAVTRMFDRATLREFALRVAMPMSAADSSNLIDTPAASQLNQHRALLYNDESGASEKFRPFGPPSVEWLASLSGVADPARDSTHGDG